MINFNNLKSKNYLIGVSGGPDSMFLLDNLVKKNIRPIVCHINYQKRFDSKNDEIIVRNYCKKNNLIFEILLVENDQYNNDNFQKQARIIRYNFFIEVAKKYKIFNLLLAHNFTDVIETYLLQKKRKSYVEFYGLASKVSYKQLTVIRPMLKTKRDEIIKYLDINEINYAIDYTNDLDIYQRNIIRQQLKEYDIEQMNQILQLIDNDNLKLQEIYKNNKKIFAKIIIKDKIKWDLFIKLKNSQKEQLLYFYLKDFNQQLISHKNYIKLILSTMLKTKKANIILPLNETIILIKEYNEIYLDYNFTKENYEFKINNFKDFKCKYIQLFYKQKNVFEKNKFFFISKNDFPLSIKCNTGNEIVKTKLGTKKINKLFIDNKIVLRERYFWPIIYNCDGKIIIIPNLATNIEYLQEQKEWFVIK